VRPYYEHGGITIYHGDCREVLASMDAGSVDLVLTDPPYGVQFRNQHWDKAIPAVWLEEARRVAAVVMFTTAPTTLWDYPRPDMVACWARPASNSRTPQGGFNHWSPVLVYGRAKFPTDLLSLHAIANSAPKWNTHPSPKPEKLFRWLTACGSVPGAIIADPFAGSGTTLRAARDLGRRAIGIEIEERYCEIAARRLSQEVLPLEMAA